MLQRGRKSRAQLAVIADIIARCRAVSRQTLDEGLHSLRVQYGDRAVDAALRLAEDDGLPSARITAMR